MVAALALEHQSSFRECSPVHRALLEGARRW